MTAIDREREGWDPETSEAGGRRLPEDDGTAPEPIDDPDASDLAAPAPTVPGRTTDDSTIPCPWCGEPVDLFLEPGGSGGPQEFYEECPACSRDVEVHVAYDRAGRPSIEARRSE